MSPQLGSRVRRVNSVAEAPCHPAGALAAAATLWISVLHGYGFHQYLRKIQLRVLVDVFNCKTSQNCLVKPQLNHQNSEISLFALIFCLCLNSTKVTYGTYLPV